MLKLSKLVYARSVGMAVLAMWLMGIISVQATETGKHTTIALSLDTHNRMHVYLTIAGEQTVGVIDTAATFPLIDSSVLKQEFPKVGNEQIEILGLNGTRLFDIIEVESLRIGNQRFEQVLAAQNHRSRFPGPPNILPASSLVGRVLDFNFLENRLDIYNAPPLRPRFHINGQFDYVEYQRLPFIDVVINGVKGKALIDTGSDTSYMNLAYADAAGLSVVNESEVELFGADGHKLKIKSVTARRFRLGRFRYRKFDMLAADTELFAHLGLDEKPTMVLGLDLLRGYRMQIDRETQRLYLRRPNNRYLQTKVIPSRIKRDIEKTLR